MKNFKEEQINSTTKPCINQYWEKEVIVDDVTIVFYYWRRKIGYPGYWGEDGRISKVVGVKKIDGKLKQKRIESVWVLNCGEEYCINQMLGKFK